MTLQERADSYAAAFPQCPGSVWVAGGTRRFLYGHWAIGQHYKNATRLYGAYPHSFLGRLRALFPDVADRAVLHAFSGSLPAGPYTRLDVRPDAEPELLGHVEDVARLTRKRFDLVIADPPYSKDDAKQYGVAMVNRGKATRTLAAVTRPGGHLAWLDCVWPMFSKELWHYYGSITVVRSTNHRARVLSLFERTAV